MANVTQYLQDILGQPTALRAVVSDSGPTAGRWAQEWHGSGRRPILFTGMGASLFAAEAVSAVLSRDGIASRAIATSDLLDYERATLADDPFLVVVSQSGESAELAGLMARVAPDRVRAVTNRAEGRLADWAGDTLVIGAIPDLSVAIRSYTVTLAALLLLAAALRTGVGAAATRILAAADEIQRDTGAWQSAARSVASRLSEVQFVTFLGWGSGIGSAHDASLLMKEGARVPSEAMSAAQFRHGAVEVVDRRQATVFFMNDRGDAQREDAWAYVAELMALDTTVVVIGPEPPSDVRTPRLLHVRAGDTLEEAGALAEIVPIQLLAAELAQSSGFEAGSFRNTTPVVSRIPVRTGG